jgi:hypothetical protein
MVNIPCVYSLEYHMFASTYLRTEKSFKSTFSFLMILLRGLVEYYILHFPSVQLCRFHMNNQFKYFQCFNFYLIFNIGLLVFSNQSFAIITKLGYSIYLYLFSRFATR